MEPPAAEGPWRSRAPGDPGQAWPVAILVVLESPDAGMHPGMCLELLDGPRDTVHRAVLCTHVCRTWNRHDLSLGIKSLTLGLLTQQ